jgi:hypothetical protein
MTAPYGWGRLSEEERIMFTRSEIKRSVASGLMALALAVIAAPPGIAREKYETIDGNLYGTSTQMGQKVSVKLLIYGYSTDADRQILVDAYKKGQHQGLVNALEKMPSMGRLAITGTVGYDVAFIRVIPTPTGRKIRFVTNRLIRFGEAWTDSLSKDFNLTAGEIDINSKDSSKSAGIILPAAQLVINKNGQLDWELNQNPWRLAGIIDWDGPKGEK